MKLKSIFGKSLKTKLLVSLTTVFAASFLGLALAIIYFQGNLMAKLGQSVFVSLDQSSQVMQSDLQQMDKSVNANLKQMEKAAQKALSNTSRTSLEKEKEQLNKDWENALRESSESLVELLAKVGPKAILSNQFGDLISYVKSASSNPDIVFAMYVNKKGKPLTRYFDKKNPKIKAYIDMGEGKKKHQKIISASAKDEDVFMVEKPMDIEGEPLGKVILCVSKAAIDKKSAELTTRFDSLVKTNTEKIHFILNEESSKVALRLSDAIKTVSNKNNEAIQKTEKTISESSARAKTQTVKLVSAFGAALGLILLLVIGFMLISLVIKPIIKVARSLEDIAQGEGDLTTRLEIASQDEVGVLAKWFNVFMEKLQNIIKDIADNSDSLHSSADELSNISSQMSSGADITSTKSNTVASAAEEMSATVTSIASTMGQASTNIQYVASSAEQMSTSINEIAQNSEKASSITSGAVSLAKSSSDRMEGLTQAAQEINKVTETITEISDQTNLLALNATIEAARAGEAGKGFAVVANEIKDLARQTAEATYEIRNRITGIQDSISGTIKDMQKVPKVINDVNEIVSTIAMAVEEQSATTKEIAKSVAQTSQGILEVNDNVTQSSSVSENIAKDISEVNDAAGEIANSSSQVAMSAEDLSKLAGRLNDMVSKFKV